MWRTKARRRNVAVVHAQSRMASFVEAATDVVVGYGLAVLTQMLVLPRFGIEIPFSDNLAIGAAFTAVSLARSYTLRRVFEALRS